MAEIRHQKYLQILVKQPLPDFSIMAESWSNFERLGEYTDRDTDGGSRRRNKDLSLGSEASSSFHRNGNILLPAVSGVSLCSRQ